ncbi:response regulator transcription factor [Verrucomicrobiales bacterium]|nr:response regulator transcription factor [Verrucomicrobiales bacterium]
MKDSHRVLIVEDDPTLLRGISDNFKSRGYCVETAMDGERASDLALAGNFDLIVLDVMIPKVNGYEVCRYVRGEGCQTPIIFLTARNEESDLLLGLGLGADDYMTKPFSIRELFARVEAVLRRSATEGSPSTEDAHRFGRFLLDTSSRKLREEGNGPVKLSPKEYDLLSFFLEKRGTALSRERIMSDVWGHDVCVTSRSIDRFVTQLRKVIETHQGEWIETIREYGYRFRPEG